MMRSPIVGATSRAAFAVLAVVAGLVLGQLTDTAVADTDVTQVTYIDEMGTTVTADVNFSRGHIARNVIVGDPIEVCTDDYPNAAADAVEQWNSDLQQHTPPYLADTPGIFTYAAECEDAGASDFIEFVRIDSREESDTDYFCSTGVNACFLWPPRTRTPHYSYIGELLVIMNDDRRPHADDKLKGKGMKMSGADSDFWKYRRLVRTAMHELGHALGLGDYPCKTGDAVITALMYCSAAKPTYPLQAKDFEDYRAIYLPNIVEKRIEGTVTQPFAAPLDGFVGTVVFKFDASNIFVEEQIVIRRWDDGAQAGEGSWNEVKTFPAHSGQVTWISRNEPEGKTRTYRIFTTTQAYIPSKGEVGSGMHGQCFANDSDCDESNNDQTTWSAGERIGFPTAPVTVKVPKAGSDRWSLNVVVDGIGTVTRSPNATVFPNGRQVTLKHFAGRDTDDLTTTYIIERAVLSTFAAWGGDDDAEACNGSQYHVDRNQCWLLMVQNRDRDSDLYAKQAHTHHRRAERYWSRI